MTLPSTLTPPKSPFVLEYEYLPTAKERGFSALALVDTARPARGNEGGPNMAATLPFVLTAPIPSALRPRGPTASDMLPPRLSEPAAMKEATAL
jgi:hypothetical protein